MSWIPLAIDMARQRHYSSPQLIGGRFIASSPHGENEIKEKKRHRNAYQFQCMHYQATPTIKSDRPELRRRQLHPEEMPSSQSFSIHLWMCSSVENSYLSFYQSMDERRTTGDIEPQHALVPATSATYLLMYLLTPSNDLINGNSYISEIAIFTTGIFQIPSDDNDTA